jgi:hypothetical protein
MTTCIKGGALLYRFHQRRRVLFFGMSFLSERSLGIRKPRPLPDLFALAVACRRATGGLCPQRRPDRLRFDFRFRSH